VLPQLGVEILARRLLLLILISFPVVSWHQSQVLLEISQPAEKCCKWYARRPRSRSSEMAEGSTVNRRSEVKRAL
jgi:hypothetical protein